MQTASGQALKMSKLRLVHARGDAGCGVPCHPGMGHTAHRINALALALSRQRRANPLLHLDTATDGGRHRGLAGFHRQRSIG